jgi:transposase
MPAPLSMDLRRRLVEAVKAGSSIRQAAKRFSVSPSAAIKLMQRVARTGSPAPDRYGGHRRPALEDYDDELASLVALQPDITLVQIQAEIKRRHDLTVGLATIHRRLHHLGLRLKKRA